VLDEADKMLSLGLEPQLERLRALLLPAGGDPAADLAPAGAGAGAGAGAPLRRPQVQLWTATMPAALRAATARWLQRPRRLRAAAGADAIGRSVVQVRPASLPAAGLVCVHEKVGRGLGSAQRLVGPCPGARAAGGPRVRGAQEARQAAEASGADPGARPRPPGTPPRRPCAPRRRSPHARAPAWPRLTLPGAQAAGAGQRNPPRVLIFVNRIKTARFVAGHVAAAGFRTALLHGERPQAEREARSPVKTLNRTGTLTFARSGLRARVCEVVPGCAFSLRAGGGQRVRPPRLHAWPKGTQQAACARSRLRRRRAGGDPRLPQRQGHRAGGHRRGRPRAAHPQPALRGQLWCRPCRALQRRSVPARAASAVAVWAPSAMPCLLRRCWEKQGGSLGGAGQCRTGLLRAVSCGGRRR